MKLFADRKTQTEQCCGFEVNRSLHWSGREKSKRRSGFKALWCSQGVILIKPISETLFTPHQ